MSWLDPESEELKPLVRGVISSARPFYLDRSPDD